MKIYDYYVERTINSSESLISKWFKLAVKIVFKEHYANKIIKHLGTRINVTFKNLKKDIEASTIGSNKIEVNRDEFSKMNNEEKLGLLLHEFIHILQKNRSFIILKTFKEIHDLTNKLNKIVRPNIVKPYSFNSFLIGVEKEIGAGSKYEILAYLMNDRIKWEALKPEARKKFVEELKNSNLFKLDSQFWKKRLKRAIP
jgi:hypothetical protein